MKLLLLFGNSAVGKMTVGQELARITPFRLFHNHNDDRTGVGGLRQLPG